MSGGGGPWSDPSPSAWWQSPSSSSRLLGRLGATDEPDELVRGRKVAINLKSGVVKEADVHRQDPDQLRPSRSEQRSDREGRRCRSSTLLERAGSVTFSLPAGGWKPLLAHPDSSTRARTWATTVIRRVRVGPKILKAVCKNFSGLTPPFSGEVAVILEVRVDVEALLRVLRQQRQAQHGSEGRTHGRRTRRSPAPFPRVAERCLPRPRRVLTRGHAAHPKRRPPPFRARSRSGGIERLSLART